MPRSHSKKGLTARPRQPRVASCKEQIRGCSTRACTGDAALGWLMKGEAARAAAPRAHFHSATTVFLPITGDPEIAQEDVPVDGQGGP